MTNEDDRPRFVVFTTAEQEAAFFEHGPAIQLTHSRRLLLTGAVARESSWTTEDAERVIDALGRVADGPLDVREDYQSEVEQAKWTDAEVIDAALDYFGL